VDGERIVVSSGRDRHTGNRTRWRSDTSIFRGSFSPVATLFYTRSHLATRPSRVPSLKLYPKLNRAFLPCPYRTSTHRPRGTQSFQKPSRRTEMHAMSHCLIAGAASFVSGLVFSFHLAPLYYLTERVFPPETIATKADGHLLRTTDIIRKPPDTIHHIPIQCIISQTLIYSPFH